MKRIFIAIAILALPLSLTNCASTGDADGGGVKELGQSVEDHLPGLGNNPTTDDDPYHR